MAGLRLLGLHLPVHPSPAPHDLLDVGRRPRPPHRQQPRFGLRRRHPREGPDLGVGELSTRQRRREQRQPAQRPGDPHALPRRAQIQSYAPAQPLGAGAGAVPAAAGVELAEQVEQPGGGGVEVGRELGDLVAEAVQFRDARMRRHEHGNMQSLLPELYHPNFEAPGSPQDGARERGIVFDSAPAARRAGESTRGAGLAGAQDYDARKASPKACQAESAATGSCENRGSDDDLRL